MINSLSHAKKSVKGCESGPSQNLFTQDEPVNDQVQNGFNTGFNSLSHSEPAHPGASRGEYPPKGGFTASGGTRTRVPDPADLLTEEIEILARSEFPALIEESHGGLLSAFAAVFANPALTAKARVAAALREREQRKGHL